MVVVLSKTMKQSLANEPKVLLDIEILRAFGQYITLKNEIF